MMTPSAIAIPIASRTGKYCSGKGSLQKSVRGGKRGGGQDGCPAGAALVKDVTSSVGRQAGGKGPASSEARSTNLEAIAAVHRSVGRDLRSTTITQMPSIGLGWPSPSAGSSLLRCPTGRSGSYTYAIVPTLILSAVKLSSTGCMRLSTAYLRRTSHKDWLWQYRPWGRGEN